MGGDAAICARIQRDARDLVVMVNMTTWWVVMTTTGTLVRRPVMLVCRYLFFNQLSIGFIKCGLVVLMIMAV